MPLDLRRQSNAAYIPQIIEYMRKNELLHLARECEIIIEFGGRPFKLKLSHDVFLFSKLGRSNKPNKDYQYVDHLAILKHKPLGQGSFGVVYAIKANWRWDKSNLILKVKNDKSKRRAVKIYKKPPEPNELRMVQIIPHLGADLPLAQTSWQTAVLMRRLAKTTLKDLILQLKQDPMYLTATQYLQLSIHLLRRIKTQIFDVQLDGRGLVHLDLKPENILCAHDQGFHCEVIDFDGARGQGSLAYTHKGTALYKDPEVLDNYLQAIPSSLYQVQQYHNLFAYALICLELGGDHSRSKITEIQALSLANRDIESPDFLKKTPGFDPCEIARLRALLGEMTRFKASDRLSDYDKILYELTSLLNMHYSILSGPTQPPSLLSSRIRALNEQNAGRGMSENNELDHEFEVAEFFSDLLEAYPDCFLGINLKQFLELRLSDEATRLSAVLIEFEDLVKQKIRDTAPTIDFDDSLADQQKNFHRFLKKPLIPNLRNYQWLAETMLYFQQMAIFNQFNLRHKVNYRYPANPGSLRRMSDEFVRNRNEFAFLSGIELKPITPGADPLTQLMSLEELSLAFRNKKDELSLAFKNKKIDQINRDIAAPLGIEIKDLAPYKNKGEQGYSDYTEALVTAMLSIIDNELKAYTAHNRSWLFFSKSRTRFETIKNLKASIADCLRDELKKETPDLTRIRSQIRSQISDAKTKTETHHASTGLSFFKACLPITKSRLAQHLSTLESRI